MQAGGEGTGGVEERRGAVKGVQDVVDRTTLLRNRSILNKCIRDLYSPPLHHHYREQHTGIAIHPLSFQDKTLECIPAVTW